MTDKRTPICGNVYCCTSTHISGVLTHGWGRLGHYGDWEIECDDPRHIEQDRELYRLLGRPKGMEDGN